ncbi:SMP-30/gluconolactonase/LRE family protein [Hufsiella ginkgonis]|uniref:SMP-30/gluconolactonase/LRE family protein n=1 Tax=Hufsiella ginkgonis TaxID=2695274 RepID=A0A7K1Y2X8_9SPHI|nr:SMP-30/gluconolactonase/LRE family protein [Hufsiella ginkgonis]MXV17644.1 SMP-30/gluconolactonase/LRE family protein [Hufsiella ginkgonis]
MKKILLICLAATAMYNENVMAQTDSLTAKGAALQLISSQFSFTEGPAPDKRGNVYFTDQPNNKIWKYGTDGRLTLFMDNAGRSNGLYIDKKGNILSCADEKNELWRISPQKEVTVLLRDFEGKLLNGPNDLWLNKNGDIYFTDPFYARNYWTRKGQEIKEMKVYVLRKGKKKAEVAADGFNRPNGIVGTPDGKYLYVADIGGDKTYRFEINKDGTLTGKTLLIAKGSDGMTLDSRGNIYLCGKGVTIYDKEGKMLQNVPVPAKWTANVCFSGKNRDVLFITASESVYTIQMAVTGVE